MPRQKPRSDGSPSHRSPTFPTSHGRFGMAEPAICKKRSGAPSPGGHSALPRHYRLRVPFFDTFTFCTPGISFNLAAPARMSACETRTSRMVVSSRSSSTLWTSRGCARDHGSHRRADGECSPVARRGVAISGIAEAGMICVFIDDNGPGMDAGRIDNAPRTWRAPG